MLAPKGYSYLRYGFTDIINNYDEKDKSSFWSGCNVDFALSVGCNVNFALSVGCNDFIL